MSEISQIKKFRKAYGTPFFTATCILSGRMKHTDRKNKWGEYFCKVGKRYQYILVDDPEDPIRMKSERDTSFIHAMSLKFFYEYFIKSNEEEFIKINEMMI